MPKSPAHMQTEAATGAADIARNYVNRIALSLSLSEVRIDLSQDFPEEQPAHQCRLVTSPVHLLRIHDAIRGAISAYQDRYGSIPSVDDHELSHG